MRALDLLLSIMGTGARSGNYLRRTSVRQGSRKCIKHAVMLYEYVYDTHIML